MNARLGRWSRLLFLPALALVTSFGAATPASAAVAFTAWPSSPFEFTFAGAPTGPSLLERVDLNADPRPDLAVLSGQDTDIVSRAAPVFAFASSPIVIGSSETLVDAVSGDVDGDGRIDLVPWTDNGNGDLTHRVYRGTTSGLALSAAAGATGTSVLGTFNAMTMTDFNGDGRADLVLTGSSQTVVRAGTAAGGFSTSAGAGAASVPSGAFVAGAGDLTGDGKGEVLLAGTDTLGSFIRVHNPPSLSSTTVLRPGATPTKLIVADVTGDGKADLVALFAGSLRVYPGNGAGAFGAPVTTTVANLASGVAAADFDKNGAQDLVVSTSANDRIQLLLSKGTGAFDAPQALTTSAGSQPRGPIGDLVAADFDADGDQDVAFASRASYRLDVLRNDTTLPPSAHTGPPAPIGFDAATVNGTADLKGTSGTVWFQYGQTATYGTETPKQEIAAGAPGERPYTAALTELEPDREYHVRIAVQTAVGTNVGQDVTFRTTAPPAPDHAATITEVPDRVVAGVPVTVRASSGGSFGPYTFAWSFDDGGTAEGEQASHAFAPVLLSNAQAGVVGGQAQDGGAKRGSRTVTLTARDRFGREASAKALVTVLPNRAPIAAVSAFRGQLEYADPNALRNESVDPDSGPQLEYDQVAKTFWSFDGKPAFETTAGAESSPTVVPWRLDRAGKPALGDILTPSLELPGGAGAKLLALTPEQKTRVLAEALKQYPTVACGANPLSMFGCWPHRTSITVGVRAQDRAGATGESQTTLPIRLRARPTVDMTIRNPNAKTNTGRTSDSNQELPAGISEDTVLDFDPGNTVIDGKEAPVFYVLEIGKPWQLKCGSKAKTPVGGIVQPQIDAPLQEVARNIVLDNPFQGPDLTLPGLVGGEAVGLRAQLTNDGDQFSLAKGCVNGVFGVNSPIKTIVATNKDQLKTAIPQAGTWSAMLSVFDRIGARGNVRLDGVRVGPVATTCLPKRETFSGKGGFSWTGTCVSGVTDQELSWTRNAIDLNGVRLAPAAGKVLVIAGKARDGARVYTADGEPELVKRDDGKQTYDLKNWKLGDGGKIGVVVDDQVITKIAPRRSAIRIPGSGVTTVNGSLHQAFKADGDALYGGLPFADTVDVDLTYPACKGGGGSRLMAQLKLPEVFRALEAPKPETSQLELKGCNLKTKSVITTVRDAGAARASTKNSSATSKGRKAIVDAPGPTTLDLSGLPLGPMTFDKLLLTYEPASSTFRGEGSGTLMGNRVDVSVAVTDGELTQAGGTVTIGGNGIPIPGTPAALRSLSFNVETQPTLRFVGGARITDTSGEIFTVDGTIGFQPKPLAISLDGTGAVGPDGLLGLARVHLELADGEVSVGGYAGKSLGPFSFEVTANGSFSEHGFNIEGSGRACIFACLGVSGVLSDRGAAMCGEIDLWLVTLRPGLGVLWKGFDVDGYLDGCSIAPYRGNLKPAGAKAQAERLAAPWKQTVAEGESLLTVVASSGVSGRPPKVTLRGPGGRTISGTPVLDGQAVVDDQVVDSGAGTLVDVDRLAGKVRFVVTKPAPGEWEVTPDAGDPPLADVEFARRVPLPTAKSFNAKISNPASDELGQKIFGSLLSTTAKGPKFVAAPKTTKVIKVKIKGKGKKASRLATETVAVPYGHPLFVSDLGPDLRDLVRTLKLDVHGLLPGDQVSLVERSDAPATKAAAPVATRAALIAVPSDATAQTIAEFTVPASGKIASSLAYLPGVNGVRKRHIDAYVVGASGIPRGVVKDITSVTASKPASPKIPPLKDIKVTGKKLKLTFKAAPSVGLKSKATQLSAIITGKDGGVRVVQIKGSDFKKAGSAYTVTVKPAGAAKGATVKIVSVGLSGQVQKGGGKVKTVKVR